MTKDLVTPADLKTFNEPYNTQEARLLREINLSESQIQIACHNIIKTKYNNLRDCKVNFIQIDNGGKTTIAHKKIKKAEGTAKGFFDVVIWMHKKINIFYEPFSAKQIFIEFKRIKSFKISSEQHYWHDCFLKLGESVHYCNNTVYFEKVICKQIDNFLW